MTTSAPSTSSCPDIRRAERADLLGVYRIEQSAFPQPWPFTVFEQYLGRQGFLVADDDDIVGYVVADMTPTHTGQIGHIKDLAVHEEHRREGVGTLLLTSALGVLRGQVDTVKLEVRESNDSAIDLYEAHGFEYQRTVGSYYSNDEDALILVREL